MNLIRVLPHIKCFTDAEVLKNNASDASEDLVFMPQIVIYPEFNGRGISNYNLM